MFANKLYWICNSHNEEKVLKSLISIYEILAFPIDENLQNFRSEYNSDVTHYDQTYSNKKCFICGEIGVGNRIRFNSRYFLFWEKHKKEEVYIAIIGATNRFPEPGLTPENYQTRTESQIKDIYSNIERAYNLSYLRA